MIKIDKIAAMIRRNGAVSSVLFLLLLSGCPLSTGHVALEYHPTKRVSPIEGAKIITVNVVVQDLRSDKSKVGRKSSNLVADMAPIVPIEDVAVTFKHAIEAELRNAGFSINDDADKLLSVNIINFYSLYRTYGFETVSIADLIMNVQIMEENGGELYSNEIVSQGTEKPVMFPGSSKYAQLALNKALDKGIKLLFEDNIFLDALLFKGSRSGLKTSNEISP